MAQQCQQVSELVLSGTAELASHCTDVQFFSSQGCRMVEMSCEEHDRIAASTQFITHTGERRARASQQA